MLSWVSNNSNCKFTNYIYSLFNSSLQDNKTQIEPHQTHHHAFFSLQLKVNEPHLCKLFLKKKTSTELYSPNTHTKKKVLVANQNKKKSTFTFTQSGMLNTFGQAFSVGAAFLFPDRTGPGWSLGSSINLGASLLASILAFFLSAYYLRHRTTPSGMHALFYLFIYLFSPSPTFWRLIDFVGVVF